MFAFVARQPILDREKDVFAYELVFRDGKGGAFPEIDPQKVSYLTDHYNALGLDDICGEKLSFISFSAETLISRFPTSLNPESVVVELTENPFAQHGLLEACKHIKHLGFKLAVDDPMMLSSSHDIFPLIDILKVDVSQGQYEQIQRQIPRFLDAKINLVAEQVNTYHTFNTCRDLGFHFFQGYFFAQPEARIKRKLPASKLNLVDLIAESSQEEFNLDKVNQIVERDAAISYLLLRFINNPTVNKRHKITSLRHALNYMGEVEVKKFIALLSLANLNDEKPLELLHMSMVRARFFDLLATERGIKANPPIAFLIGLFSMLDALLDQEMIDVVAQLPLADEVYAALLGQSEEYGHYLTLVRAFEGALWLNVVRQSRSLNIDQKRLHALYNQAIVWGNNVRTSLSQHFPKPTQTRPS